MAVITPCKTDMQDGAKVLVSYKKLLTTVVLSLTAVENVIGRVKCEEKWGVIDRSSDIARTVFVDTNEELEVDSNM